MQTFNGPIDVKQGVDGVPGVTTKENKSNTNVKNHNFETTFENFNMLQETRQERNSSLEIVRPRPKATISIT